jgi:hypothetical protein
VSRLGDRWVEIEPNVYRLKDYSEEQRRLLDTRPDRLIAEAMEKAAPLVERGAVVRQP